MFPLRLSVKITVLIVMVLIVGFGASTIWTIRHEAELLVEQNKMAARPHQVHRGQHRRGHAAGAARRHPVGHPGAQGGIARGGVGDLPAQRSGGLHRPGHARRSEGNADLAPAVMANIRKMQRAPAATLSGPLFSGPWRPAKPRSPWRSGTACPCSSSCIPSPTRSGVRAATAPTIRYEPSCRWRPRWGRCSPRWAAFETARSSSPVLTIVAAAAVLTVAMRRVVVRPVEALAAAARRVGDGDFTARAARLSRDELGRSAPPSTT